MVCSRVLLSLCVDCLLIGFEWMLKGTADGVEDSESDGEIVAGVQKQTLPATQDHVDDNQRVMVCLQIYTHTVEGSMFMLVCVVI